MSKPTKKELALDILAITLMDAIALAGILFMIPHVADDPIGAIAMMLIFAVLGVLYTGAIIREDRKRLKQG